MGAPSWPATWERYRRYLEVDRGRRPDTIRSYRRVLYDFVAYIEPKPWQRARDRDLARFLARRPLSTRARGPRLGPNTRSAYGGAVRVFYAWAYASRLIPRDPMALAAVPTAAQGVPRALPVGDLRTILVAASTDQRLTTICALAYFAGMRAGEIARARIEHVHFGDRPAIRVDGKGGKLRHVPLHPELERILRAAIARAGLATGPLVPSHRDPAEPIVPNTVSRLLSNHLRGLGIDASGHALRHSAATEMLTAARGKNLEQVRAFLGHRNSATTRIYVASYDWDVAAAVAAMPDPRG